MIISQVLYSGLGGHGSVAFGLIEGGIKTEQFSCVFYGIEPLKEEYRKKCENQKIPFSAVHKKKGLDIRSYVGLFKALNKLNPSLIILHSVTLLIPLWVYCHIKGKPFIFVEHQPNEHKRPSEWAWTYLSHLLAPKIVYLTELYRQQVADRLKGWFRASKTTVIPNGNSFVVFPKNT